jgi:hypothetical protein
MSFFNFFMRNRKSAETNPITNTDETAVIDPTLFVDNEKPEAEETVSKTLNPIEKFLDQEFEWLGYQEGYAYPDTDHLDHKVAQYRSEFRLAVDKCMDAMRSEASELKIHMIKTEGISVRLYSQLVEKLKLIEANIHELDTQKILSVEDEGMVGPAVHAFRLGFRKGVDRYQQEKFIAGSTGLFNN